MESPVKPRYSVPERASVYDLYKRNAVAALSADEAVPPALSLVELAVAVFPVVCGAWASSVAVRFQSERFTRLQG